jgi:TonB-linked SusC/RagA family outer membrane protein
MNPRTLLRIISLHVFLFLSLCVFAQNHLITGRVVDAGGNGIPGVSVVVKGTSQGTTTDSRGSYSLNVPANSTLVVSSVGYELREVPVSGNSVNVSLQTTASNLNEVVVVGYGTTRKKDITGSVANVTSKDFQKGVITTPEQLIAGKVAGVAITSNGGAPGAGSTIRIRGGASLNASNDPLIVVDGVPLDYAGVSGAANALSLINPNDIESFSILKDASAAAIYGSRASNGVILITTKKGRTGRPTVNFSTQFSVSKIMKGVDVMSPQQFRDYVAQYGTAAQQKMLGSANNNWQDLIYQTALATDNNISLSGGVKNLPYRFSYGFLDQNGILRTDNLKRHSASLNLSPSLFQDHLKINLNLKGSVSYTRFANQGAIGDAVNFDPTQPVNSGNNRYGGYFQYLDPNNSVTGLKSLAPLNPLGILEQYNSKSTVKRAINDITFDYKLHFLPDLHANLNLGYDIADGSGTVFIPDSAASSYNRFQAPSGSGKYYGGVNNQYHSKNENKLLEAFLSYAKDIKSINSHVDATAGYSYQDFKITNYNFPDYSAGGVLNPGSIPAYAFNIPEHTLISFYGRLNYNYAGKYFLSALLRRDGSSRFAPENRWGTFPAFSAAWKIKEESFLKSSQTLSDLKLRAGYGVTGQQEGIGYYDYISYYNLSDSGAMYQLGNSFYKMYRPGGYYYNRKWEQTATFNIALDFGFLNNRINGTIEYYKKKTKDLLNAITQPAGANFTNRIVANIGNMENEGVEFTLNTTPVKSRNLTWDFNFNISYNKNQITNLTSFGGLADPGLNKTLGISGGVGSTIALNQVGNPINSFYVYQQVYDQSGKPIEGLFVDRNRDGVIDQNDLYLYHSPNPDVIFGLTTGITYKKWSAGVVLRGNFDNYVYNNTWSALATQRNLFNPLGWLNNAPTNLMATNFIGSGDKYLLSDYYVQNASFVKMDNANINYDFGRVWNNRTTLRVSFNVQNVFVITKYKGLDPEIGSGVDMNFYPRPRTYVLGVNLGF